MFSRRVFTTVLASAAAFGPGADAAADTLPFYASVGPSLILYGLEIGNGALVARDTTPFPANVQYAWPDPLRKILYVVASNGQPPTGPIGAAGADGNHYAMAYHVGPGGTLTPHGAPQMLAVRPLHVSVDQSGEYLLIAYNIPSHLTVHRLNTNGSIGEQMKQSSSLDFGIYAHQVRATPSGKTITLCSRGNDGTPEKPEDPGHLEVFGFHDGQLSGLQSLAPHGQGLGFGPRHLDFHPTGRFAYVSLERENSLCVYGMMPNGTLSAEPLYIKNALLDPDGKAKYPGQTCGPIHVHPNGRFVYQTNRGSGTMVGADGRKVWNGGENSIAVWALDTATGEPTRIQNAPAHGFELRTFAIDPSGRNLIAASTTPMLVADGGTVTQVSAGLSVYRIGADGTLSFLHKLDVDTSKGALFWSGFLTMA